MKNVTHEDLMKQKDKIAKKEVKISDFLKQVRQLRDEITKNEKDKASDDKAENEIKMNAILKQIRQSREEIAKDEAEYEHMEDNFLFGGGRKNG